MIRTATDIDECQALWRQFSPAKDAWDDWDLIFAFHDERRHELRFMVHEPDGTTGNSPDGLIPLVYDTTENRHILMGGSYPDGRVLWVQTGDFPEIFQHFPDRTVLFDLKGAWVDALLAHHPQYAPHFAEEDQRYYLVPSEFGFDFNNHIDTFSPDKRQGFLYDLRKIRKREPSLHWSDDDECDLFIRLCNKNFGAESDYANEEDAKDVRRVIAELRSSGRLKTLVIRIDGAPEAVSMSLLHNNKMVALYASSNNELSNLGKLVNVETIQEACRLRFDEISYMTGMSWKVYWKMKSEPCRT
ncbi:MAG: GNAT family N-acetyltransferase, partial [Xanthomonadales bacterium]|nr:GNAT family N-acetyltransferase [Xanthomonadales bacterium]